MLRADITSVDSYMVSMRIRPDVAYTESSPRATTPRLFSDSLVGDANIRLFANGQLFLFVLRYGCRTEAYAGGFPVLAWTTLTAVVGGGRCRVYVNGTLHSEGHDARWDAYGSLNTVRHGDPYLTGQFFRGRMDNLQLFSDRLPGKEVASLHTSPSGKLVRDVPSKRLFVQTKTLDMNNPISLEGVKWSVAVMIPRADIMRVVDANRRKTLSDVQIQEDNTQKELTQKANATIMIIVVIAMTSVVAFLVFNNMMTRPFEETAVLMAEAAVLRIDSIPSDKSLITELGAMNIAMRLMLENLKLYKSFMPQSVQLDDAISEEESVEESSAQSKSQSAGSAKSKTSTTNRSASRSSAQVAQIKQQLQCSLVAKKFTFLVMNVRKWHARIAKCGDAATITLHASLIEHMLEACTKQKGVNEMFSGDRFACSFNAAKMAGHHKVLACTCAIECRTAMGSMGLSMSSAAVSGDGRVGNIGNAAMRRFSFLTPVITWGYALERLACEREASVVVDSLVASDAEMTMSMRLIDAVSFPKLTENTIRVHEVLNRKEAQAEDEWMYQLEEAAKNDPMKAWNECAEQFVKGIFEVTQETKDLLEGEIEPPVKRLVSCWKASRFDPCVIAFH